MTPRRVRIILRGSLRKLWEDPIEVVAATAEEALSIVTSQIPGFQPDANGPKRVRLGGFNDINALRAPLEVDEIHLFPQVNGGRNNGLVQILVAVVLIAVAFLMPGTLAGAASAVAAGTATFGQLLALTLFMSGVSMAIGGLVSMLFPAPDLTNDEQEASKYLGVPRTTVAIGTPIRVIFGRRKTGFHVLSFGIHASRAAKTST